MEKYDETDRLGPIGPTELPACPKDKNPGSRLWKKKIMPRADGKSERTEVES